MEDGTRHKFAPPGGWVPPARLERADVIRRSDQLLGLPDRPFVTREDVFRIRVAEMDWDIGCQVYEPVAGAPGAAGASPAAGDTGPIATGADGKRVGMFLLHGGAADHRYMDPVARLVAGKLGYKAVAMTYPGRLYLSDASRNWPGDTINPDGTVRTPIWCTDSPITPDQYEVVQDRSDLKRRQQRGTVFFAAARTGTEFYDRMAAWPLAYEAAMREVCRRHFPPEQYSVYGHGHSTGGPFVNMLSQRVPNFAGIGGMENSPFGSIYGRMKSRTWPYPFHWLYIRTWRDEARYMGPEAGPEGVQRLPMLMEEVFESWERTRHYPQFKAEFHMHFGAVEGLAAAAAATARRLQMNAAETAALVQRYQGYTRELAGPDARPVPPLLLGIAEHSVDHTLAAYEDVVLPAYRAMVPAPGVHLVQYAAGIHAYMEPEPELPMGVGAAALQVWAEAIAGGYYLR